MNTQAYTSLARTELQRRTRRKRRVFIVPTVNHYMRLYTAAFMLAAIVTGVVAGLFLD